MRTWLAYVRSGTIAGWNPLAVRHALGSFVNQRPQHQVVLPHLPRFAMQPEPPERA